MGYDIQQSHQKKVEENKDKRRSHWEASVALCFPLISYQLSQVEDFQTKQSFVYTLVDLLLPFLRSTPKNHNSIAGEGADNTTQVTQEQWIGLRSSSCRSFFFSTSPTPKPPLPTPPTTSSRPTDSPWDSSRSTCSVTPSTVPPAISPSTLTTTAGLPFLLTTTSLPTPRGSPGSFSIGRSRSLTGYVSGLSSVGGRSRGLGLLAIIWSSRLGLRLQSIRPGTSARSPSARVGSQRLRPHEFHELQQ